MDLASVDAIVLRNIKNKNIPFVMINVKTEQLRLRLIKNRRYVKDYYSINDSAIITTDSVISLQKFLDSSRAEMSLRNLHFYVLCFNLNLEDILTIKRHLLIHQIFKFFYYFVDEKHFIKLFTIIWLSPENCNLRQVIEVNRFVKVTGQWQSSISLKYF